MLQLYCGLCVCQLSLPYIANLLRRPGGFKIEVARDPRKRDESRRRQLSQWIISTINITQQVNVPYDFQKKQMELPSLEGVG